MCVHRGFRRTLVRLKLQPLRAQSRHRRFRRTLVRLKREFCTHCLTLVLAFQTNSREVEA